MKKIKKKKFNKIHYRISVIKDMVNAKSTGTGSFPDFDHAAGDPNEGQIKLDTSVEVVFVEGNYVLLKQDPWCELSNNIFGLLDKNEFFKRNSIALANKGLNTNT